MQKGSNLKERYHDFHTRTRITSTAMRQRINLQPVRERRSRTGPQVNLPQAKAKQMTIASAFSKPNDLAH
jgi:hypothetical protein